MGNEKRSGQPAMNRSKKAGMNKMRMLLGPGMELRKTSSGENRSTLCC
jgi:hypothetical protein